MNDENEMLPFCMRCFHVGAFCDDNTNFCHMCGSEGTCINIKRGDIEYIQSNIKCIIEHNYRYVTNKYGYSKYLRSYTCMNDGINAYVIEDHEHAVYCPKCGALMNPAKVAISKEGRGRNTFWID